MGQSWRLLQQIAAVCEVTVSEDVAAVNQAQVEVREEPH
jgi:hypothetical protein